MYKIISTLFILSCQLFGVVLSSNLENNSLIVYNSNLGLVHESRALKLSKDDTTIIYEDVASTIDTDSVNISLPSEVSLYSQQYRYDKLTQNKLLNAHIGKKVSAEVMLDAKNFRVIPVTLLSNDGSSCIVKHIDQIISVESKNIIFDTIPETLITKSSLVWNVKTEQDIDSHISIDYLIKQINWRSNYILNLYGDIADLSGWISIENHSGKAFENTKLHVLAGDINRVQDPRVNYRAMKSMAMVADASSEVAHQAHEGYHFYTIPFKVNLANNEKTQIKFLSQNNIDVKRIYSATMSHPNYLSTEIKHNVTQLISMKGLEFPLPQGVVRTYSKLSGTNILLGETNIQHTPKETPISLRIGKNFDLKVKEVLINRDRGSWNHDNDVKYIITNNSDEPKELEILVPFSNNEGDQVKSKLEYTFTKGNLVTFRLNVATNSTQELIVHYRNRVQK